MMHKPYKVNLNILILIIGLVISTSCGDGDGVDDGDFINNNTGKILDEDDEGWSIPVANVLAGQIKDGIPAVDNPQFTSASEVTTLGEEELIIGYKNGDEVHGYPHQILDWHEIVNDNVSGDRLSVTYCPLTGTAIGWNREIDGNETTFGVSGLLFNTNLMPYDRQTNSVWSQMLVSSVNGELRDRSAELMQIVEMPWGQWKRLYPNSKILNRNTSFDRQYGKYPYGNYRQTNSLFFPVQTRDDRVFGKERVLAVIVNDKAKLYRFESMMGDGSIRLVKDELRGQQYVVAGNNSFMNAFGISLVGDAVEFQSVQDRLPIIMEDNLGNQYDIFGTVVEGPNVGEHLEIIEAYMGFFFSFGAFYPNPEIFEFQ